MARRRAHPADDLLRFALTLPEAWEDLPWVTVHCDGPDAPDAELLHEWIVESYRAVAPKTLCVSWRVVLLPRPVHHMARIEVADDWLVVHMEGVDRILALRSTVSIPLAHVAEIDHDPDAVTAADPGLRMGGTHIPSVVTAGTFLDAGEWTFWDVHDPQHAVIIRLHDDHYGKLVIGVDYPDGVVAEVRQALAER